MSFWKWSIFLVVLSYAAVIFIDTGLSDEVVRLWNSRQFLWHATHEDKLKPGDHIYSKRYLGLYTHHGIYLGNRKVIHFIGTNMNNARIKLETLDDFSGPWSWRIRLAHYGVHPLVAQFKFAGSVYVEQSDPADVVLKRARELLSKSDKILYDLWGRNCEAIAFHCKTGKQFASIQADTIPILKRDWKVPHRLIRKSAHWILKVVGTILELAYTIATFEVDQQYKQ